MTADWLNTRNEVERAYKRIAVLKRIIQNERRKMENFAASQLLRVQLGLSEEGDKKIQSDDKVRVYFNELEVLLDFLHIAHMAASFEFEAQPKILTHIGTSRSHLRNALAKGTWPLNLIRDAKELQSLRSILSLLNAGGDISASNMRDDRNTFCHGFAISINRTTKISAEDALALLLDLLTRL